MNDLNSTYNLNPPLSCNLTYKQSRDWDFSRRPTTSLSRGKETRSLWWATCPRSHLVYTSVKTGLKLRTCFPKLRALSLLFCIGNTWRKAKGHSKGTEWVQHRSRKESDLERLLRSLSTTTPNSPHPMPCFGSHPTSCKFDPFFPNKRALGRMYFSFPFGFSGTWVVWWGFLSFPTGSRKGGDQEAAVLPGRYSLWWSSSCAGRPQTGRGERGTITVISREEGLPGNSIMRRPSCCSRGECVKAREEKLKRREDGDVQRL